MMPTANDPPDKNNAPLCKSSLMSQDMTVERIDRAIAWYEANAQAIDASLPIVTPGILYRKGYLESLDRYISAWKSGNMPLQLAVCYVHRPISTFFRYQVEEKEKYRTGK